jgi:ABC-type antimicrobial peptide transport system permease subunit
MDPVLSRAQFGITLSMVLLPAALVIAAVLIGSFGPALRASRIPPAQALRIVD